MKMKFSKSLLVTVVILLVVGWQLWYEWNQQANARVLGPSREQEEAVAPYLPNPRRKTTLPVPTPPLHSNQMTKGEIIQFAPRQVVECRDSFGVASNQVSGVETNK